MKTKTTGLRISANLKAIEWLKGEVLSEVSHLFKRLSQPNDTSSYNAVGDILASIITMSYTLARRLGISYTNIDSKIEALTEIAQRNEHELQVEFSDMSELNKHIKGRK